MSRKLSKNMLRYNPLDQFHIWFDQARVSNCDPGVEPNAMSLATCSKTGKPSVRIVLMKECNERGFVFFTNYNSRKAEELAQNPNVSLLFFWPQQGRQIRVEGLAEKISEYESDAYFQSRPRLSRIGAHASPQSKPISSRRELITRFREISTRFRNQKIDRPSHWGGYIVLPSAVEFWQAGSHRLHDRFRYEKDQGKWKTYRLAP